MSHRMRAIAVLSAWVACSGGAWFVAERQAARLEYQAEMAALARADVAAEAIEQNLLRTLEAVESLHDLAQSRQRLLESSDTGGAEAIEAQLALVARRGRFGVLQVGIIGRDGLLTWSSLPQWRPLDLSDREHFRIHREGYEGLFVSAPLIGRASDLWSVQLTRPLRDSSGAFAGVAVVSINPLELGRDLANLQFGAGSSATVLRKDGIILARSSDMRHTLGQVIKLEMPLINQLGTSHSGRLRVEQGAFDGRPKLAGYRLLAEAPLLVAVALDAQRELAPTAFARPALRAAAAAISLLGLALAALVLLWLERQRTQADLELARREREAMLERLAQSQRMEALGRLAGGVAHDFNNVLQAVLGGAKAIQRRAEDAKAVQRMAGIVVEAAERGASVTRRLLAFARRGELRAEAVDVGALFASLREVLTYTLGANTQVRIEAPPALPRLLADRGQLETVLVNLAINGRDAMALRGGGMLTLSAAVEEVPAGDESNRGLAAGTYLRLGVTDTGTGMDPAVLARAAEPFFTTKPKGKGTGLGLAMAKGFAEQSGGALRIRSQPGRGTTVLLWLPRAEDNATGPQPAPSAAAPHRAGRILLVDDAPQVRSVLAANLRDRGHAVEEAENGHAALALLAGPAAFDVLVSDLAMPGMDGLELLRRARRSRPGLPALLVTGYAGDVNAGRFAEAAGQGPLLLLRKPVTPEELTDRIATLLHAGHTAPPAVSRGSSGA
ncbi:response regulator [Roseomonas sp. E05]|uniref:response regulator n=1 Tax=Roseomonas sp. E05 TaxID=3046310 RepID=UPI0024B94BE4|nr:response regulator [Roseomonas sp. E05]MDJ0387446.1 response regulator [Roseomonas sp. E05]